MKAKDKKPASRPGWNSYFMQIAHVVKLRSNCLRREVGAVIVHEHRIISTGYNGTPSGITNCNEGGCPRCAGKAESGSDLDQCVCAHAEENAIVQAARHGVALRDSFLYCTTSPCLTCAKMIITAGIRKVFYDEQYSFSPLVRTLFKEAGVACRRIKQSSS